MLVTRTDLKQWASRTAFQGTLPHLVRRLIHASVERTTLSAIGFPAEDGVSQSGYDGVLQCSAINPWIPDGRSVWEMGVSDDHIKKATDDYKKRTKETTAAERANTTFVFVTPRVWDNKHKDKWVADRASDGWKDVRAYAAENLEEWLEQGTAVAAWLARRMNKYPPGLLPLETWWEEFSAATTPALEHEVVLAGRSGQQSEIAGFLDTSPSAITVVAPTHDEALAFVACSILSMKPDDRAANLARTVIVNNDEARRQAECGSPLIMVLDYETAAGHAAPKSGHHVVKLSSRRDSSSLVLPPLESAELQAALEPSVGRKRSSRLQRRSYGRLSVLRRAMATPNGVPTPEWAEPSVATKMAPLLLTPAWETADGSRVAKIAGMSISEIDNMLTRWEAEGDAPLERNAKERFWVAEDDAWGLLAPLLQGGQLERFEHDAVEVLSTVHPRFSLPADRRIYAAVHGHVLPHSSLYRAAIARTVARLGARDGVRPDLFPQRVAERIVRETLSRTRWELWATLGRDLMPLAEAAPDVFLDAVESAIADPSFVSLFKDEGSLGPCHHAGLLWALERLAWAPEYLTRVSLILASLVESDPPGQTYANRPLGSLRRIFLSWQPQTTASPVERFKVLETLQKHSSLDVLLRLLRKIMPQDQSVTTGNNVPEWREWGLDVPEYAPNVDVDAVACWAFDKLLTIAGETNVGWPVLLRMLTRLHDDDRERVVAKLEGQLSKLDEEDPDVRHALREVLHQHRQFSSVDWRIADAFLVRLEKAYNSLEPEGAVERFRWMFDEKAVPLDPIPDDWEKERERFAQQRTVAAESIFAQVGLASLSSVLDDDAARRFGEALAASQSLSCPSEILVQLLDEGSSVSRALALGFYRGLARQKSSGLPDVDLSSWHDEDVVRVFASLTPRQDVWALIDSYGVEVRRAYWKQCGTFWVPKDDQEAAVEQLLEFERPFASAALCALRLNRNPVVPHLVVRVLKSAAEMVDPRRETPPPNLSNLAHGIAKLLRYIEGAPYSDDFIAKLELGLLAFLRFEPGRPRALRTVLSRNPNVFSELVRRTFPDDGEDRFELGYDVLRGFRWVPGARTAEAWSELLVWYEAVKAALSGKIRHSELAKTFVGQSLADTPVGADGIWPNEAMRELIESEESRGDFATGVEIGVKNSRGVVSKSMAEGGGQERKLKQKFVESAAQLASTHPKTARLLRSIADGYDAEAVEEDTRATSTRNRFR